MSGKVLSCFRNGKLYFHFRKAIYFAYKYIIFIEEKLSISN